LPPERAQGVAEVLDEETHAALDGGWQRGVASFRFQGFRVQV
jgi:hypothetical protein